MSITRTRITQSNQICRERGGILEQRRRPTVKLQSHFALSHVVAMSLAFSPSTADRCLLGGRNPSALLRKGSVSRFAVDRNCGIRVQFTALSHSRYIAAKKTALL